MIVCIVDYRKARESTQGGLMITSLSTNDSRILCELQESFPGSPDFAEYLSKRLKATNGSLALSRLMSHCLLKGFPKIPIVTGESVTRLGVDEDIKAIGRLNEVQLERRSEVLPLAMYFRLLIERTERESKTIDLSYIEDYHHIFWCAFAMLSGIEIDPRSNAQVA